MRPLNHDGRYTAQDSVGQTACDVVGGQNCGFGGGGEAAAPIMAIYIQEIGKMLAEPYGAAETAPMPDLSSPR